MSEDNAAFVVGLLIGGVVAGLFGFVLGAIDDPAHKLREEAIRMGVAEYVITDPKTGDTEFRWKSERV